MNIQMYNRRIFLKNAISTSAIIANFRELSVFRVNNIFERKYFATKRLGNALYLGEKVPYFEYCSNKICAQNNKKLEFKNEVQDGLECKKSCDIIFIEMFGEESLHDRQKIEEKIIFNDQIYTLRDLWCDFKTFYKNSSAKEIDILNDKFKIGVETPAKSQLAECTDIFENNQQIKVVEYDAEFNVVQALRRGCIDIAFLGRYYPFRLRELEFNNKELSILNLNKMLSVEKKYCATYILEALCN